METNINIYGILIILLILTPFLIIFLHVILGVILMGMQKKVILTHSVSGLNKYGYFGYCWTYCILFFFTNF